MNINFNVCHSRKHKTLPVTLRTHLFYGDEHHQQIRSEIGLNLCGLSASTTYNAAETEVTFGLHLFVIYFYLSFGIASRWIRNKLHKIYSYESREIGFHLTMGGIFWHLWTDPNGWSDKIPKWRQGSFYPADFFLGEVKHSQKIIRTFEHVLIPMPEKSYLANIQEREETWKRKRWFPTVMTRYEVEMIEPIPEPGKYGQDTALESLCTCANNLSEAVSNTTKCVLEQRLRRGTYDFDYFWTRDIPKAKNEDELFMDLSECVSKG